MRQYLLRITVAALICAFSKKLIKKPSISAALKLVCGIFLAVTVVSPWVRLQLDSLQDITDISYADGLEAANAGEKIARDAMEQYIINQTQAYILDKANALGVSLCVQVSVSADDLPVPVGVKLTGTVPPYARSVLEQYISDTLGIGAEEQLWSQS